MECPYDFVDFKKACKASYKKAYEKRFIITYKEAYIETYKDELEVVYETSFEMNKFKQKEVGYSEAYAVAFSKLG